METASKNKAKMKSKSFTEDRSEQKYEKNKSKQNKSMNFTKLFKSASDTNKYDAENNNSHETPVTFKSAKPKKGGKNNSFALGEAISTPISNVKLPPNQVKPIIKNSSSYESSLESPNQSMRKKRNKSVSFCLEEESVTSVKRVKSDTDSTESSKKNPTHKKLKFKKDKINLENENTTETNELLSQEPNKKTKKNKKEKKDGQANGVLTAAMEVAEEKDSNLVKKKHKNKKLKHLAKGNTVVEGTNPQAANGASDVMNSTENKEESIKKTNDVVSDINTDNAREILKKKKKKKEKKSIAPKTDAPEISDDLKNLKIGDNAHTLTNLLDDMTVVDKSTKIKSKNPKQKLGKMKRKKTFSTSSTESLTIEKLDADKIEKVKWQKRKWNKDEKSGVVEVNYSKTVIVENLPLEMIIEYKKLLKNHLKCCGHVKEIGIAEVYPSEDTKPVFTTTVTFTETTGVMKALGEDNSLLEGHRIRIKRPLPPTETTLVVKSFGELTEQTLSSTFHGAGKIRKIKTLYKAKGRIGTSFVEFDGPEAVERAAKMAEEAKIGGKRVYTSKFEIRGAKKIKLDENEFKKSKKSDNSGSN